MTSKKYEFLEIKEGVTIPTPRDLTPEEEAAILAQLKEEFDEATCEAELKELLRQQELGLLVPADELEKEINELAAQYEEKNREPT
jgi:hypothetical protein